jgi:hypothetical protein
MAGVESSCEDAAGYRAVPLSSFGHICGLRALLTFGDFEFHLITFLQAFVSLRTDRAVMNEDVRTIRTTDKSVSLSVIEPLHSPFQTFHEGPSFCTSLMGAKDVPAITKMHFGAPKVGCQDNEWVLSGAFWRTGKNDNFGRKSPCRLEFHAPELDAHLRRFFLSRRVM